MRAVSRHGAALRGVTLRGVTLREVTLRGDRGAGSILALGVLATIVATLLLVAPLCRVLVVRAEMTGAADAAALAAADVAIGISPGVPCVMAASVAAANGALLNECRVDGVIVTVRVSTIVLALSVTATATAGPPQ